MADQQRPSNTQESLLRLREAEQKVLSALRHAAQATKTLSTADATLCIPFKGQAESFLTDLYDAQTLLRAQIDCINTDRPFENVTMRRLVESDLAVQRVAHVHRSLAAMLSLLDETPVEGISTAASPSYMPSPVASTPGLGGVAATPPAAPAVFTVAVPSPDATGALSHLSAQVGLNGGLGDASDPPPDLTDVPPDRMDM